MNSGAKVRRFWRISVLNFRAAWIFSEQKFFFLTLFPYICTQKANKRYL